MCGDRELASSPSLFRLPFRLSMCGPINLFCGGGLYNASTMHTTSDNRETVVGQDLGTFRRRLLSLQQEINTRRRCADAGLQ